MREIMRTGERERGRRSGRELFEQVILGVGDERDGIREIVRTGEKERKRERVI